MEGATEVSTRRRWWLEHKDDPRIRDGFRASSRRYYEKNVEVERARKREYYQKKKLLATPPVLAPVAETPAE
jgi:hypothetical protein